MLYSRQLSDWTLGLNPANLVCYRAYVVTHSVFCDTWLLFIGYLAAGTLMPVIIRSNEMSNESQAKIEVALKGYVDPYLEKDLVSAGCIKSVAVDGDKAKIEVSLGFPAAGQAQGDRRGC